MNIDFTTINEKRVDSSLLEVVSAGELRVWFGNCCKWCDSGIYAHFNGIRSVSSLKEDFAFKKEEIWNDNSFWKDGIFVGPEFPRVRHSSEIEYENHKQIAYENCIIVVVESEKHETVQMHSVVIVADSYSIHPSISLLT